MPGKKRRRNKSQVLLLFLLTLHTNPVVDVDRIILFTLASLTGVVTVDVEKDCIALKGIMAWFTYKESYTCRWE